MTSEEITSAVQEIVRDANALMAKRQEFARAVIAADALLKAADAMEADLRRKAEELQAALLTDLALDRAGMPSSGSKEVKGEQRVSAPGGEVCDDPRCLACTLSRMVAEAGAGFPGVG
jgi:hypothetical protein